MPRDDLDIIHLMLEECLAEARAGRLEGLISILEFTKAEVLRLKLMPPMERREAAAMVIPLPPRRPRRQH